MPAKNEQQLSDEREWRFKNYWENVERIRERNRQYYYTKQGLPVPEKRKYRLRLQDDREELYNRLKEWETLLVQKEADLKALQEQLKANGITPVKTSKIRAPIKMPKENPYKPPADWVPEHTISITDFK